MLDVHPPHAATHTWRDFFVHIATIVVGLLIAIGLEQMVEAIHHRRVRAELRESLHADGERVILDAKTLDRQATGNMRVLRALTEQAEASLKGRKLPNPPLVPYIKTNVPIFPAWQAAKAAGEIAVLPPSDIKAFSEAEHAINQTNNDVAETSVALSQLTVFIWSHAGFDQSLPDLATLTAEQKQEYIQILVRGYDSVAEMRMDVRQMRGAMESINSGERDLAQIKKAESQFDEER